MLKAVSLSVPHYGGTYSVFRQLRSGFAVHGIDLRWLAAGQAAAAAVAAPGFEEDGSMGTLVAPGCEQERDLATALLNYVATNQIQLVLLHGFCGAAETLIARYLPSHVIRIMAVHTITPATYRAVRSVRDWVHATIGVSPRIRADLIRHHGFSPKRTFSIINGINVDHYCSLKRPLSAGPLRVLVHGRVEDMMKGVLWVPDIVRRAVDHSADLRLTVSGGGTDLAVLRERFERAGVKDLVSYRGWTEPAAVPEMMAGHDVLLFPSRFEGLGIVLLEAMAAGCVPIASRIGLVTDQIISDGATGILFNIGDTRTAAAQIVALARDRDRLGTMSANARDAATRKFSATIQTAAYVQVIRTLGNRATLQRSPLLMADWQIPREFRPTLWHKVPKPLKKILYQWRERLHLTRYPDE